MNPFVLVAVIVVFTTGCIEQNASDVKDINIQVNQTVTGTEPAPTIVQTPEQTPQIQQESNTTADGTGDQIRDAIAEALESSNPGGGAGK